MENTTDDGARQLVIFCDGTNNTLTAGVQDTNVLRLHAHLAAHPAPQRLLYYDPGVGTPDAVPPTDPADWFHRTWERVSGLASGRGVYDNIEQAYLFLMRSWRGPQDRIYAFGFSRGAFTVRCVVGMVNLFGILAPQYEALLPTLIRVYFSLPSRSSGAVQEATRAMHHALARKGKAAAEVPGPAQAETRVTRESLAEQIRTLFTTPAGHDAWVHWVGVWDTVESVGLPGPLSRSNPATATMKGKRIRHVRHALSFDEHRWTFEPRLYEEPGDVADPQTGQTVKQRWFPGVHCDVGGSYLRGLAGLSDEALEWMVDELSDDLGVPRLPASEALRVRHDALWDTPWWALTGMTVRDMQPTNWAGEPMAVIPGSTRPPTTLSVWAQTRAAWPLLVALVLGFVCLLRSGLCLLPQGFDAMRSPDGLAAALAATKHFADAQLGALLFDGVIADGQAPWQWPAHPAWAMFWDLAFIACWGYLLARVSSRAFAWLAGSRRPQAPMPAWRWLGMAPMVAVLGDVGEDVCTLLAMLLHGIDATGLGYALLWLGSWGSVAKLGGLVACVPLVAVRLWIALPGVPRYRL